MSARMPFTRWERDRLGKLVLRQSKYRVIGRSHVLERGLAMRDAAMATILSAAWFALVLLIVLAGCSGAAAPETQGPVVFTPQPALEKVTRDWAARWSAATGVDVSVGPGGIPVVTRELELCGVEIERWVTATGEQLSHHIEVDVTPTPGCVGWGYTLGHEMGHALGAHTHAADGLLGESMKLNTVHVIDAAALELVCDSLECADFRPETLEANARKEWVE